MMNMSHAKKAQALASDLDYRKRLHDYTVNADDIKVQQAKKAYNLQSEVSESSALNTPMSFDQLTWFMRLSDFITQIHFHPF